MAVNRVNSVARAVLDRLRRAFYPIVFLVLLGAVVLRVADPPLIAQFRLLVFDTFQRISPREANPEKPVIIIDIDDESLKRVGQWPWPRSVLADMMKNIRRAGAAAVGLDFVFPEPDRLSPEQVIKFWPAEASIGDLRRAISRLPHNDDVFAEELAKGRVVLGFIMTSKRGVGSMPVLRASFAFAGADPKKFVSAFPLAVNSLAVLSKAAAGSGFLNWIPDYDQVVRRIPLLARVGEQLYPAMAIEVLRVAQGASTYIVKSSGASGVQSFGQDTGIDSLRVGSGIVPVNANGELQVHFSYRDRSRYISAWKILSGKVDMSVLAGRIVLVGTSAAGLFDLRATPLEAAVPGIEVHAQAIEQIIDGHFLYRPDFSMGAELAIMIIITLILIFMLPRAGVAWSAVAGAVIVVALSAVSYVLFLNMGWLVDPVYPSLSAIAVYLTGSAIVYLHSETERRQVRDAFSHYLSPPLVEQLAANPGRLVLGGELRDITVLFADVRGFTTISEGMSSAELIAVINKVLTPVSDAILEYKGTIDKYMGDAVMAFWNAPLDDAEHARNAALAALAIQAALGPLNDELRKEARSAMGATGRGKEARSAMGATGRGKEARSAMGATGAGKEAVSEGRDTIDIKIGVGLSTGPCSVGNMGTKYRFDYSAIGDDVNIASRLEGQTKIYGVDILMAEQTARECGGLAILEIDRVRVKGKTIAVDIFALMGDETMAGSNDFASLQHAQKRMLSAYRSRQWDEALARLAECRGFGQNRLEHLYRIYEGRICEYRKNPPPEDWDGSYTSLSK